MYHAIQARIQKFFRGGGLRRKILKENCLLIHVSTSKHIKTKQTCNSFSRLPFQEDCHLFFALFYYPILFLKFERGGANPVTPPLDPPMQLFFKHPKGLLKIDMNAYLFVIILKFVAEWITLHLWVYIWGRNSTCGEGTYPHPPPPIRKKEENPFHQLNNKFVI